MTQYELNFSLLVEQMLSKIVDPAYRQIMVEVTLLPLVTFVCLNAQLIIQLFQSFMVVSTILERNPELSFKKPVEMDKVKVICLNSVHFVFSIFQLTSTFACSWCTWPLTCFKETASVTLVRRKQTT